MVKLLEGFNKANAKVALLCNHQKNISKNFSEQTTKLKDQIKDMKEKKIVYKLADSSSSSSDDEFTLA